MTVRVLEVLEATLGGTRRYLEHVCQHVDLEKISLGFAYSPLRADLGFERLLKTCMQRKIPVFSIPMHRAVRPFADLRAVTKMRRLLQRFQPDVVHAHSSKAGAVARMAVASLGHSRPRIIYSPHSIAAHIGARYLAIERLLAPLTDRFVTVSSAEQQELVGLKIAKADRIVVARQGIDATAFDVEDRATARRRLGISETTTVVVGVGRLSLQKDPLTFVRAVARAHQTCPQLEALWVGDGEMREETEKLIQDLGASAYLRIIGWSNDIAGHLSAADMVLHTAIYEGISTVCGEALAARRPVIAAATPGTEEVVRHMQTGLLFPVGDWEGAAEQLMYSVRNRELIEPMVTSGHDWVTREMSPDGLGATLTSIYLQMAAGSL